MLQVKINIEFKLNLLFERRSIINFLLSPSPTLIYSIFHE